MSVLHIFVLAVIQGITEFLPISSSGHLALVPWFVNWPDQGLVFDIAVHVGTLMAVMIYFWRDLISIIGDMLGVRNNTNSYGSELAKRILLTLPPVFIAGGIIAWLNPNFIRSIEIIAITTPLFGVFLWMSDKYNVSSKRIEKLPFGEVIFIGLAQAVAVIPGTSRSGITISTARMMGVERTDAARFSMLISIPVIIGAASVAGYKLGNSEYTFSIAEAGLAVGISFITALLSIAVLMKIVKLIHFGPFAIYRIILGAILLIWIYVYDSVGLELSP